ncbi:ORF6 [White spot syndrome virus]|uniref:ORF6 n=1 Tax=White spot syndrome virus TaxID=342409 RepID=A0A2D3I6H0_9VIRU|nr:ORF6 [White spot syndrome virus]
MRSIFWLDVCWYRNISAVTFPFLTLGSDLPQECSFLLQYRFTCSRGKLKNILCHVIDAHGFYPPFTIILA